MAAIINLSPFSWNYVGARSDLDRFYLVRDNLHDEKIVWELEDRRGNGRDDCLVRAMWTAVIAGVVSPHLSAGPAVGHQAWQKNGYSANPSAQKRS